MLYQASCKAEYANPSRCKDVIDTWHDLFLLYITTCRNIPENAELHVMYTLQVIRPSCSFAYVQCFLARHVIVRDAGDTVEEGQRAVRAARVSPKHSQ